MKGAFAAAILLSALLSAPALAEDGRVPSATLSRLGLSGMKVVSDSEGTKVRGNFTAFVRVRGTSFIIAKVNGMAPVTDIKTATSVTNPGSINITAMVTVVGASGMATGFATSQGSASVVGP